MQDKNKILVPLNASLVDAMKVLRETGLRIVFIHDDDYKIVGVLTDGDIRSAIIDNGNTEAPVVDHMNKDFVFVYENTPLSLFMPNFPALVLSLIRLLTSFL